MADRISGGDTQAVQRQQTQEVQTQEAQGQEAHGKSPASQAFKGRGVQQDGASPVRQSSSPPGIKQGGGKSWKARAAKLDGLPQRGKTSVSNTAAKESSKSSQKTTSPPPTGRPPMPAPYKGLRTLERGATARSDTRPTLSRSNFNDVRRSKFKEQFQQRAQDYDRRSGELNSFQQKTYQDCKGTIASLLKQNPGDTAGANKQFGELANHARMIEDLFHGDSSYLAKLTIGDW